VQDITPPAKNPKNPIEALIRHGRIKMKPSVGKVVLPYGDVGYQLVKEIWELKNIFIHKVFKK
jgi:hypothetical protein